MSVDIERWQELWRETFVRDCQMIEVRQQLVRDNRLGWKSLGEAHGMVHMLSQAFDEFDIAVDAIVARYGLKQRDVQFDMPLNFPILHHLSELLGVPDAPGSRNWARGLFDELLGGPGI